MSSVSRKDIVAHLKAERDKLTEQLSSVETALKAFLPPSHRKRLPVRAAEPDEDQLPAAPRGETRKMVEAQFKATPTQSYSANEMATALGVRIGGGIYRVLNILTEEGVISCDVANNTRVYKYAGDLDTASLHVTTR